MSDEFEVKTSALKKVSAGQLQAVVDDFNVVFKFDDDNKIKYNSKTSKAALAKEIASCFKLVQPDDQFKKETIEAVKALGYDLVPESAGTEDGGGTAGTTDDGKGESGKGESGGGSSSGSGSGSSSSGSSNKTTRSKTRTGSFIDVINALKKARTMEQLAEDINNDYIKAGGKDNLKQTTHLIGVMMPCAVGFGKVVVEGDKVKPA